MFRIAKLYIPAFIALLLLAALTLRFSHRPLCAPQPPAARVVFDREAGEAGERLRPRVWQAATKLVVVAGHAIYKGGSSAPGEVRDERNWFLEPYQAGMVDTFIAHIRRGVEVVAQDPAALLVFAGGVTRPGVGPRSEGASYWEAANALDWFGAKEGVLNRTHVEPFSRDSMENLLFSVCRFKQLTGRYPHTIEVISFEFKRTRFDLVHRRALRFPREHFVFTGVDPPNAAGMRGSFYAKERAITLPPFSRDPYACKERILHDKRLARNPTLVYHPYPGGCEDISALFTYCGHKVYSGSLPWDRRDGFDDEIKEDILLPAEG